MELRHLRYFAALAQELSFTRAAQKVHVTQSTLSHQIGQMEVELGQHLFDRTGKRIVITEAGETFLLYATRALREVDEGMQSLKKSPDPLTGHLRIGATHTFNLSLIPDCLAAFLERHPLTSVLIEEHLAADIENKLESEKIDLGIAYDPQSMHTLLFEPLYVEEMVLVVAKSHPLAARRRLRLAELHKQKLVMATSQSLTRRILDSALDSIGAEVVVVAEIDSVAGMLAIVERTNLAAIVSRLAVSPNHNLSVVALEGPTPLRTPGLLSKVGKPRSAVLRAFVSIIRRRVLDLDVSHSR